MQAISGIEPSGNNQNGNQNGHGIYFLADFGIGSGWVEWVGGAGAGELKRSLGSL